MIRFPRFLRPEELGTEGQILPSALLRIFQQSAIAATEAAELDSAWYRRHGLVWVIRRTRWQSDASAPPGMPIRTHTWISRLVGSRAQREYLVHAENGLRLASGRTEWVLVDAKKRCSASPPVEVQLSMAPPINKERGFAVLGPPQPPPNARARSRSVQPGDLDGLGHVNNARYVEFCMEDFHFRLAAAGAADAGLLLSEGDVEYIRPTLPEDHIDSLTWIHTAETAACVSETLMLVAGGTAARARCRWQWEAPDPRLEQALCSLSRDPQEALS